MQHDRSQRELAATFNAVWSSGFFTMRPSLGRTEKPTSAGAERACAANRM
jgi:hypothetical protein